MVVKHFQTDALQELCTDEQLDLLNSIDNLRSQGINHYISLPQIIVCGDQSSGKSSVLEAISGVSFPVKSSLCTKVPHRAGTKEDCSSGCTRVDSAMGITTHGKAFSNDVLRVEVSGPDRPHLTIVDLPGLIHSETKQQSAADVQLVQEVVRSYITEPRSIILAVISAKNDFAHQIVLKLARDADSSGDRTLGVITKPDTLVSGSESEAMFLSLARNQDVEFRLGWHVLKNMDTEKGNWTLADRDRDEMVFFSQGAWRDLPRALVGVSGLRSRLSKVLLGQIAAELPSLISEIKAKTDLCKSQFEKLGEPRATLDEQRSYLLRISQSFQVLVKAAVDGTYNDPFFEHVDATNGLQKRLRAVIQNLNEAFTEHIARKGHYRHVCEAGGGKKKSKHQIRVTRAEYTAYIGKLLRQTRGRELPGTFNPMIVRDLFLEQCGPWETLTRKYIEDVWSAARNFIILAVRHVADDATSTAIRDEIIFPIFDTLRQEIEQKTTELLVPHKTGHPITYNHYFTETLQKIRAERREAEISKTVQRFFGVSNLGEPYLISTSINLNQLVRSLLQQTEPNMVGFASAEAFDCMLAYYKVALKRYVDDIANEVVESKLMLALIEIFSPVSVFDMHDKVVTRIAGESEENRSLREQLNRKLQVLGRGTEICQRFVGIRCSGTRP
ncbi:P-loop containing nucleoside triphosphate hydrolase protein [Aspergillus keveii]|uniref:P-loop containing nucleoside triphosphate hydrolase protein n=1 Tax=Aspergillus keveii TaxID=714993 RepID=A0ABR4G8W1_9EURO